MNPLFFLSTLIFVTILNYSQAQNERPLYLKLVDEMRQKVIEEVCEKYDLKPFGAGGELMYNVKSLSLDFRRQGSILSKNELRKLLVDLTEHYLKEINSNATLKPYLNTFPFKPENISINVFLYDIDGEGIFYPNYAVAGSWYGEIIFFADDGSNPLGVCSTKEKETYEEALKKIDEGS